MTKRDPEVKKRFLKQKGFERAPVGKEVDHIESINAEGLIKKLNDNEALNIIDSRRPTEFSVEHAEIAKSGRAILRARK